jgi:hypothetical protein
MTLHDLLYLLKAPRSVHGKRIIGLHRFFMIAVFLTFPLTPLRPSAQLPMIDTNPGLPGEKERQPPLEICKTLGSFSSESLDHHLLPTSTNMSPHSPVDISLTTGQTLSASSQTQQQALFIAYILLPYTLLTPALAFLPTPFLSSTPFYSSGPSPFISPSSSSSPLYPLSR